MVRTTPLDIAAVISAALCDRCRERLPRLATLGSADAIAGLCDNCRELPERVLERMRTGIHPDALAALAARILKAKRRGERTGTEASAYMRRLAAMPRHPSRKPKPS